MGNNPKLYKPPATTVVLEATNMVYKPIMERTTIAKYPRSEGGHWQLDLDGTHGILGVHVYRGDDYIPVYFTTREVEATIAYLESWLREKADGKPKETSREGREDDDVTTIC